jgi:hypothetical protein
MIVPIYVEVDRAEDVSEALAECQAVLQQRQAKYPALVANNKLSPADASRRIRCMASAVAYLSLIVSRSLEARKAATAAPAATPATPALSSAEGPPAVDLASVVKRPDYLDNDGLLEGDRSETAGRCRLCDARLEANTIGSVRCRNTNCVASREWVAAKALRKVA